MHSEEQRKARIRSCWTDDDTDVEWGDNRELKWSADEMLHRAMEAARFAREQEAKLQIPLEQMPPDERKKAYKQLQRRLKKGGSVRRLRAACVLSTHILSVRMSLCVSLLAIAHRYWQCLLAKSQPTSIRTCC